MFALLELDHGDFGPIYASRDEALAGLEQIRQRLPEDEASSYDVVELDDDGFPMGEEAPLQAATH
jgi:hypothetical protein